MISAITLASGGVSGGLTSMMTGGDFWAGAKTGLIVAGLNHVAHMGMELFDGGPGDPPLKSPFEPGSLDDMLWQINAFFLQAYALGLGGSASAIGTGLAKLPAGMAFVQELLAAKGVPWEKVSGIVRAAAKGKGNFGLGSGTLDEAMTAGRSWVGDGYRIASDGKSLVSADGLRIFRPPSFKPRLGKTQANFEWKTVKGGQPQGNGHLDIINP